MADDLTVAPDSTAVRVALWRAMHVEADPGAPVLDDEIGLQLAGGVTGVELQLVTEFLEELGRPAPVVRGQEHRFDALGRHVAHLPP